MQAIKTMGRVASEAGSRGLSAYHASPPAEGLLAGVKHALGGAKNVVAESMGGKQVAGGGHSLVDGLKDKGQTVVGNLSGD